MKCPSCFSEDVRRSRRRGPKEGTALRLKHQAPFRCQECGLRFIEKVEDGDPSAAPRRLSIADYLGLRGWARRAFSDHMILGTLVTVLLALLIGLFFAVALGWIEPRFLLPEAASR
ncbi:MAG: hypothetical protein KDI53_03595 [Candidatus Accumulibacter sp.]|nr:hypothetical protein [Accumulibacter sp.]